MNPLNLAAIYHLPVIFIIENNHYAASTPVENVNLLKDLCTYAEGFGIPGFTVDGNDAVKVYNAMAEPIKRARSGLGPTLIEYKTYRHKGHHVNDPGAYMPQDILAEWKARDPLIILRNHLDDAKIDPSEILTINENVDLLIAEAVKFAVESPEPSPSEFLKEIMAL